MSPRRCVPIGVGVFALVAPACVALDGLSRANGSAPTSFDAGAAADSHAAPAVADAGAAAGADAAAADASLAYRDAVLADGPIAYYRLGEASGTVAREATGKAPPGTYVGAMLGAQGAFPRDGDMAVTLVPPSYVDVGDAFGFPANSPFSIEAWVRPKVVDTNHRVILAKEAISSPRNGYALVYHVASGVYFERDVGGVQKIADGHPLPVGTYTHVVGTYDGSVLRLFVNGDVVGSGVSDTASMPSLTAATTFGATSTHDTPSFLDGDLDDVAFYDKALPLARVKAHFDAASR